MNVLFIMRSIDRRDRGSQYLSIRYTERLTEAGIEASVGSVNCALLSTHFLQQFKVSCRLIRQVYDLE